MLSKFSWAVLAAFMFLQTQRPATIISFSGVPSGNCNSSTLGLNTATGDLYTCKSGAWYAVTGGAAPTNATYITQTPNTTLTNEQALSLLATGILKGTTSTGVVSIALSGTDYEAPLTFSSPLSRLVNTISCPTCLTSSTGVSSITGTANQVIASASTGAVTLSTPQDIATSSTPQFARVGLGAAADSTANLYALKTSIGASTTDGLILSNTTPAAVGAQQFSPALHFIGQGWKTASTAGSQQIEWTIDAEPAQAVTHPVPTLVFRAVENGSATTSVPLAICAILTGDNAAITNVTTGIILDNQVTAGCRNSSGWAGLGAGGAASIVHFIANAGDLGNWNVNGFLNSSGTKVMWASGSSGNNNTGDTGLERNGAGVVGITSGTATGCATAANCRDLTLRHEIANGTAPTVASTTMNSCGTTSPTIAGKDMAGRVTVGATSGTSCTVTFGTAWTTAPVCLASNETTGVAIGAASTTTTTVLTGTFAASDVLSFQCKGY